MDTYDQAMLQRHLADEHETDDDQARRLAQGGGLCPVCTAAQVSALDALRQGR